MLGGHWLKRLGAAAPTEDVAMDRTMAAIAAVVLACGVWAGAAEVRGPEQLAAEVGAILAEENVRDAFDLFRIYKDMGFTYQPSLAAPNDLADRLEGGALGAYAGMKLFDAIYAATFLRRQEAADAVAAIERAQDRLDLRSHADVGHEFLRTLRRAAAEPENVDVRVLLERLAADYAREVPAMMAHPESAAHLVDAMYGFTIQLNYVRGILVEATPRLARDTSRQFGSRRLQQMTLDLFEAVGRMGETVGVGGEAQAKIWVVRSRYELDLAEAEGRLTDEDSRKAWRTLRVSTAAVRQTLLTPGGAR